MIAKDRSCLEVSVERKKKRKNVKHIGFFDKILSSENKVTNDPVRYIIKMLRFGEKNSDKITVNLSVFLSNGVCTVKSRLLARLNFNLKKFISVQDMSIHTSMVLNVIILRKCQEL